MEMTLRKALQLAVATENNGIKFYERLAKRFEDNQDVASIFTRLAKDEIAHESEFNKLLDNITEDKPLDQDPEQYDYLRATSISEFFRSDIFDKIDQITDPTDALIMALNFEKSTKMYYEALALTIGESPELQELINHEKGHVTALMKVILTDAKFRTLADSWA